MHIIIKNYIFNYNVQKLYENNTTQILIYQHFYEILLKNFIL